MKGHRSVIYRVAPLDAADGQRPLPPLPIGAQVGLATVAHLWQTRARTVQCRQLDDQLLCLADGHRARRRPEGGPLGTDQILDQLD